MQSLETKVDTLSMNVEILIARMDRAIDAISVTICEPEAVPPFVIAVESLAERVSRAVGALACTVDNERDT